MSFLQTYKTSLVGLKLLLALSFFDKRYCLYLKTLSYICSQTRTTIANYCLLPWERMEIVQGILGENLFFFFFFLQAVMAVVFPGWDCIAGSLWETSACKMLCKYILHITCAI